MMGFPREFESRHCQKCGLFAELCYRATYITTMIKCVVLGIYFLKNEDIVAIPLMLAFLRFSTPRDPRLLRFFSVASDSTALDFFGCLAAGAIAAALASAIARSCSIFRCAFKAVKLRAEWQQREL